MDRFRKVGHFFTAAVERLKIRWRQWVAPDRYRPEKHYMRGPAAQDVAGLEETACLGHLETSCLKNSGRAGGGNSPAS